MLILSRKPDESLIIEVDGLDEPIEIIITELNANQVRLGIQAPQGCKIWRKELLQTVEYNKQAAAAASASGIRGVASKLTSKTKSPEKNNTGKN
ncbi:MAG: carbon storage regulator [Clostridiales bacterium]|nr:carbon storage regulator [Clostridiales bacterium]